MHWKNFIDEIKERFISPFKYPQYVGYFIFCILLIGATGVYITIWDFFVNNGDGLDISKEMGTYLIAILGTSILDLNLSREIKNKDSFFIYSLIILLIGVITVFLIVRIDTIFSFILAFIGVLLAWFIWWFANADNLNLTRESVKLTKDDTTGGDTDSEVNGSTEGFKS